MENLILGVTFFLRRRVLQRFVCLLGLAAAFGYAQSPTPPGKLAFVLPTLLDRGIEAADPVYRQLLRTTIAPNWVSLNASTAAQLSNLPIPSPASSYSYYYDRTSGSMQRRIQSHGPVLTERAETIGKGSFFVALTYQRFLFDRLDDVNLGGVEIDVPLTNPIADLSAPIQGIVHLSGSVSMSISQVTAHFTMGLTPWLDVSYAFPVVSSSLSVRAGGTLRSASGGQTLVTLPTQLIEASSTGLGDGVVRAKARLFSKGNLGVALASDVRLPTGDELNYHGAGAYGVKPFVIVSFRSRAISPHFNGGYQWNGKSFLASPNANEKRSLPGQLFYSAGFDSGLFPKLTASFDLLDQIIIDGERSLLKPLETSAGSLTVLSFQRLSRHELNAAAGVKVQVQPHVVLTANLLFRMNQTGLRARVIPLAGLAYVF